jgi:hypothetical protein
MFQRRTQRIAAGASVLCALLGGACASEKAPGVRTDSLQADIVFGVDLPETEPVSVSPVAIPVGDVAPTPVALTTVQVAFRNRIPSRFKDVPFSVTADQTAASCPRAPLGSTPTTLAPETASNPPAPGVYRYKIEGTRTFTYANGAKMTVPVSGFQPRVIRNVVVTPSEEGSTWTYEMVQPDGAGGVIATTWSVNPDPTQVSRSLPYVGENPIRVSEPDAGLSLTRVQQFDGNGNAAPEFNPISPVAYLQMPVLPGQEFTAVGVDPNGRTEQVTGQALKRQTVDACGTLIDGWLAGLDVTDARGVGLTPETRHEEIVVATDRGALITSQRIVQSFSDPAGTSVAEDITFSIGQLTPDPAPTGS